MGASKRVLVRTYGCQMNVHDSEKVTNLLRHQGYVATERLDEADLLVINTCSIRDKAEHRLYSDLGQLRAWKQAGSGRILAVGGCVAQQTGDALLRRFDQVDFVFGTHNLRLVPALAEAALRGRRTARTAWLEDSTSLERFDLPERHRSLLASQLDTADQLRPVEGLEAVVAFFDGERSIFASGTRTCWMPRPVGPS